MFYRSEAALVLSKVGVELLMNYIRTKEDSDFFRSYLVGILSHAQHREDEKSEVELWYWDSSTWFNEDIMPTLDYIFDNLNEKEYRFIWIEGDGDITNIGSLNEPFNLQLSYTIAICDGKEDCL